MCEKMTPVQAEQLKKELKAAFDKFDKDKSGQIEAKEFEGILEEFNKSSECKKKMDAAKIKEVAASFIKQADKDADGKINFYEFLRFMKEALGCKE